MLLSFPSSQSDEEKLWVFRWFVMALIELPLHVEDRGKMFYLVDITCLPRPETFFMQVCEHKYVQPCEHKYVQLYLF